MTTYTTQLADQAAQADEDRTKRLFIGFLSSALGVDQTMTGADQTAGSQTGQFTIANPDGTYSVQGQPISNLNSAPEIAGIPMGLLLLVGLAYVLLK